MKITELRKVKQAYKRLIYTTWKTGGDFDAMVLKVCLPLGTEMCYNHHERGQRLWAFTQALKEFQEEVFHEYQN